MVPATEGDRFDDYVIGAQQAGLEVVAVKRVDVGNADSQLLVTVREPNPLQLGERLEAPSPLRLREQADLGKPVLYEALAKLLLEELPEAAVSALIPAGSKGSQVEVLMEVIAQDDPRALLLQQLGMAGLHKLLAKLEIPPDHRVTPVDAVLRHFGLATPTQKHEPGFAEIMKHMRYLKSSVPATKRKEELRGVVMEICSAVERLLKLTIWGWSTIVFGESRDAELLDIVSQASANPDLSRLSFGQLTILFKNLPDRIAQSEKARWLEQKIGRRHVYPSNGKATRFFVRLEDIVGYRNRVEHDKVEYWSGSALGTLKIDGSEMATAAEKLLLDLCDQGVIPAIAIPIEERRDPFGRLSYILQVDDAIEKTISCSSELSLGKSYLYFGSATNPQPVDPLLLNIAELGKIP